MELGEGRTWAGQRPCKAPPHCRAPLYSSFPGLHCKVLKQLPVNRGSKTNARVRFILPYTSANQQNTRVLCKHLLIARLDDYKSPMNECKCLVHMYTIHRISHAVPALVDSGRQVQSRVKATIYSKAASNVQVSLSFESSVPTRCFVCITKCNQVYYNTLTNYKIQ